MNYTLISTEYIPESTGIKLVQGVKFGKTPRGAISGGNGSFLVREEKIPAEFYFRFKDENDAVYEYDGYFDIIENMMTKRLTEKRRTNIALEVSKIAAKSYDYEPEKWIIEAVKKLKI